MAKGERVTDGTRYGIVLYGSGRLVMVAWTSEGYRSLEDSMRLRLR